MLFGRIHCNSFHDWNEMQNRDENESVDRRHHELVSFKLEEQLRCQQKKQNKRNG